MRFQRIDLWIVALYLLVMLLIAFWQRRFADASLENFFLDGAQDFRWLNGVSHTACLGGRGVASHSMAWTRCPITNTSSRLRANHPQDRFSPHRAQRPMGFGQVRPHRCGVWSPARAKGRGLASSEKAPKARLTPARSGRKLPAITRRKSNSP
jgi:hypothetical protein